MYTVLEQCGNEWSGPAARAELDQKMADAAGGMNPFGKKGNVKKNGEKKNGDKGGGAKGGAEGGGAAAAA